LLIYTFFKKNQVFFIFLLDILKNAVIIIGIKYVLSFERNPHREGGQAGGYRSIDQRRDSNPAEKIYF